MANLTLRVYLFLGGLKVTRNGYFVSLNVGIGAGGKGGGIAPFSDGLCLPLGFWELELEGN